jgi:hypothetical protein
MHRCSGIKPDGTRCTLTVEPPETHCWHHTPKRAEQRRRAASRGGRGKASRELPQLRALLEDLTERVLSGDLGTGPAAVANQLINTRLRAIEQERKVREIEDVLTRLEALEEAASDRPERRKGWRRQL